MCSCSKVKNESVRVIQTDSFSNDLVIQINKIGKYCIYIPSDTIRSKFVKLAGLKAASEDSIWEIKISEISNADTTPIQRQISCNIQNDNKTCVNANIYSI